jgi:hypothetical protein
MVALVYNKKGPSELGQSNWGKSLAKQLNWQRSTENFRDWKKPASFTPSDDLKEPYFMFLILARQLHTLSTRRPKSFILISRRLIV